MKELFNFENADNFRNELVKGLNFPFITCQISTLGDRENISILLLVCYEPKENWINGILENSKYKRYHILNNGECENFIYSRELKKTRKFTAKNINQLIEKINKN